MRRRTAARSSFAARRIRAPRRSSCPSVFIWDRPSAMFSVTVRLGTSMYCWCTMPMPQANASLGERKTTSLLLMKILPSSGVYRPIRMFIRVVLPAPFSPTSASTSPLPTESEMSLHATTPGKRLVMCSMRRLVIGWGAMDIPPCAACGAVIGFRDAALQAARKRDCRTAQGEKRDGSPWCRLRQSRRITRERCR